MEGFLVFCSLFVLLDQSDLNNRCSFSDRVRSTGRGAHCEKLLAASCGC